MKMIKKNFFSAVGITFLAMMLFTSSCEEFGLNSGGSGALNGKISIGPLCPVETDPPNPACQPTAETYKAFPVAVWSSDMKVKIATLAPALDGTYSVSLPSGTWIVVLESNTSGVGGSNLPVSIKVTEGANTQLDINIDTGIR
jgi:hypothetical protein